MQRSRDGGTSTDVPPLPFVFSQNPCHSNDHTPTKLRDLFVPGPKSKSGNIHKLRSSVDHIMEKKRRLLVAVAVRAAEVLEDGEEDLQGQGEVLNVNVDGDPMAKKTFKANYRGRNDGTSTEDVPPLISVSPKNPCHSNDHTPTKLRDPNQNCRTSTNDYSMEKRYALCSRSRAAAAAEAAEKFLIDHSKA